MKTYFIDKTVEPTFSIVHHHNGIALGLHAVALLVLIHLLKPIFLC